MLAPTRSAGRLGDEQNAQALDLGAGRFELAERFREISARVRVEVPPGRLRWNPVDEEEEGESERELVLFEVAPAGRAPADPLAVGELREVERGVAKTPKPRKTKPRSVLPGGWSRPDRR
ncbi:MAG: hypothetical protein QNK04_19840 [Myxococcota bacterium]|nr:hypothetical protein [Myxococcota bacterium]